VTPNGYVAIITSEPIPGVPSHRLYGPYETREAALNALRDEDITTKWGFSSTGVLPLRPVDTLKDERP
jgi:hypothetical protein